ncbi:pleiotropic drug resistance protein PDR [Trichodelitschia bisporula]|uniref:Pleiotropic drug resistance protein PDR n=1 Tax=Trichodelitschia bisporula TaxID=703511 RepID=A0A6G1HZ38_9PEZI|nr:pleiotropic drug resistance protein PDR [Trichodelitschia bisporula]
MNFGFSNYDDSAARTGVPLPGQGRRNSHQYEDIATPDEQRGLHRTTTSQSHAHRPTTATAPESSAEKSDLKEDISTKKDDDDASTDEEDEKRDHRIQELARQLTRQSSFSVAGDVNPFNAKEDSRVNPQSPNFSGKTWAKAVLRTIEQDPNSGPLRTAGVAFRNLNAYGFGTATDYQKTVGNIVLQGVGIVRQLFGFGKRRIDILRDFEGVVYAGEMLVVLGPPGSGCSTFLKVLAGETDGLNVDENSYLNYQGISANQMHKYFRGEAIYTAEVDVHFPMMTVGDTLSFAARARAPRIPPGGVTKEVFADHMRDVVMAMYGISHTNNTMVGNDFIRGVSGGERKRVTIAEATLSQAPLQCWDNSTRGLDSANALEFCRTLRISADVMGSTACLAIYQASQAAYDVFDKVIVLYEGYQIYFGPSRAAKQYFLDLGFDCPDRQTVADFLTSMTSAAERVVRPGWENRVPRTAAEFAQKWKESETRKALLVEIDEYDKKYQIGGEYLEKFKVSRKAQQARSQRIKSPYTLSYREQVGLCLWRGFVRLKGDPSLTFSQLFANCIMALIVGSVFYNMKQDTASFYSRGALLFFAILLNAFGSALEILTLYAQRPIVEKHSRYAFYHPSAEAFASMLTDMPYKIANAIFFNLVLYFMTNLRREPGAFFFFLLVSFTLTLTMSMFFRTLASVSRTLSQAMVPAAILILAIVIFTGFAIPTRYMLGWSRWINYLDPVAYGFESLLINEFHGRNFTCSTFVPTGPGYGSAAGLNHVCTAVGSKAGLSVVTGTDYIVSSFNYSPSNKWRNYGILIAFMLFLMATYLGAVELISGKKSKGEVLVFRRGHTPAALKHADRPRSKEDLEAGTPPSTALLQPGGLQPPASGANSPKAQSILKQSSVFSWRNVCYDIKIKKEPRRILDNVDGWVKPGTLTALMGVSGAGKTTLLDVLASRVTMGVITGDMLVDGRPRDASFQRKTGYVQQQDLHLSTSTVREALNFSALLRQPANISRKEKLEYVDEVIKLLEMEEYADAVVGVPGEGLNVEQRKRLTIGVELAAKPQLLLFLDEPTSGLDSQTSWAICNLMEKLTNSGQAILCTIHQPSAMLFQRFDRLLFLKSGGQTVYFGEIGKNSSILTAYFERNGAAPCPPDANPAEWMLEVIGAAPGSKTDIDWTATWRGSPEYAEIQRELDQINAERLAATADQTDEANKSAYREFAATFPTQLWEVQKRVFEQYWRTPSYIYSKMALCLFSSLFIGFAFFNTPLSQQGLQNQMFAIFTLLTIFGQLVQQIMPHFVTQRALYEVRERPSKTYSWKAFMLCNIMVELPWQTLMAAIMYFCWYYPIGMYKNAMPTDAVTSRGALMFLLIWVFMIFTSTFTHMCIAAIETAETGGNIAQLLFSLSLIFCGVLAGPSSLPGFWIFMYRVSPFTYLVSAVLSTGLANTNVHCASNEYLHFKPPNGSTCGEYMDPYIKFASGYLLDREATDDCSFCAISSTNTFLAAVSSDFNDRWRNFGIMWVYVAFNTAAALFFYWYFRMPKGERKEKKKKAE